MWGYVYTYSSNESTLRQSQMKLMIYDQYLLADVFVKLNADLFTEPLERIHILFS